MCCFSPVVAPRSLLGRVLRRRPPAVHVAATTIFARQVDAEHQALAYAMELSTAGEVAMILPVPIAPGAGDAGLTFVSLEAHPGFFTDLAALFVTFQTASPASRANATSLGRPTLVVHAVGSFEASFVPSMADWDRLDPRFRLPVDTWARLGDYADWGFAVFRLAPGKQATIHPMAFRFRTRDPRRLFFPTVHVHDGQVHATARFDHWLYYQLADPGHDGGDERSTLTPTADVAGLLAPGVPVRRRALRGRLPNRDTWIG